MLSLIIILGIIIIQITIKSYRKGLKKNKSSEEYGWIQATIGAITGFIVVVSIFIGLFQWSDILSEASIKNNIALYEEENKKIESSISTLVREYEKDKGNMSAKKDESTIMEVVLYPDLASNELVQKQIQIYNRNNEAMNEMKEKVNDIQRKKKFIFFWELFS